MFGRMGQGLKGVTDMQVIKNLKLAAGLILAVATMSAAGLAQDAKPQTAAPAAAPSATAAAPLTASATGTTTPGTPQLQTRDPRYSIHAGDSFDINFELSPEFNQTGVVVQPDGFITLRGVGDIKVDGQSAPQLTHTLETAYSKILHDPIITVILKDFEKPYFIADGQVGHPGKYDLRGTVTLTQAIAMAGGLTDGAKHSQVMLFRRVDEQWVEAKLFNVKEMEKSGNLAEDPFLHPGDMLFVPKSAFAKYSRFIPAANLGTMIKPY
jgi:polysaccharide biosynthesis/export protein